MSVPWPAEIAGSSFVANQTRVQSNELTDKHNAFIYQKLGEIHYLAP